MLAVHVPEAPVRTLRRPVLSDDEAQDKWLAEGLAALHARAAAMVDAMERHAPLPAVLERAAAALAELRTGSLAPQRYYELYLAATAAVLEPLEAHLADAHAAGALDLEAMYAGAQHVPAIIPRLYLLLVAGGVYARAGTQPPLALARDMAAMCKGVQHPVRGLFLRHYLLTALKATLPGDPGARRVGGEGREGTPLESAALLIENLAEMSWLWIRMEGQHGPDGRRTRVQYTYEALSSSTDNPAVLAAATRASMSNSRVTDVRGMRRERGELKVLVGQNIVRLAQLDGIGCGDYAAVVLPQVLSTIVRYREPIAQQYLMEAVIRVFPDDLHLRTLPQLLQATRLLTVNVSVAELLTALARRLVAYGRAVRAGTTAMTDAAAEAPALAALPHTLLAHVTTAFAVTYRAQPLPEEYVIKRCGTTPAPLPLPLASYVAALRATLAAAEVLTPREATAFARRVLHAALARMDCSGAAAAAAAPREGERAESDGPGEEEAREEEEQGVPRVPTPASYRATAHLLSQVLQSCDASSPNHGAPLEAAALLGDVHALAELLPPGERAVVARAVARALGCCGGGGGGGRVEGLEAAATALQLLEPLAAITAGDAAGGAATGEEAALLCRALHALSDADALVYAKMVTGVRKMLAGAAVGAAAAACVCSPQATVLSALVGMHERAALRLHDALAALPPPPADDMAEEERAALQAALRRVLCHLHGEGGRGLLAGLAEGGGGGPSLALRHLLAAAATADRCEAPDAAYALLVAAVGVYEESGGGAGAQRLALLGALVAALRAQRHLPPESRAALALRLCQHAGMLLQRSEQARALALCASLYTDGHDTAAPGECMRRAAAAAERVPGPGARATLRVDLLNLALPLFAAGAVTAADVSAALRAAREDLAAPSRGGAAAAPGTRPPAGQQQQQQQQQQQLGLFESDDDDDAVYASARRRGGSSSSGGGGGEAEGLQSRRAAAEVLERIVDYIRARQTTDEPWRQISLE